VRTALSQLNLQGQMMRLGEVSLVAFRTDDGNDEKRKQAEEVIKKLDARVKDQSQDQDKDKNDNDKEKNDNNGNS
ncbi:MAG: hypothetical protein KJZ78_12055, partial [Bryobacteraceae bacterium]|nr:hypothetical protein [Bryobacteraceae bacterium]